MDPLSPIIKAQHPALRRAMQEEGEVDILCRPDGDRGDCFSLSPLRRFPEDTQLVVDPDEVGIFIKGGRVVATLASGRHVLNASDFSFLRYLVEEGPEGNEIEAEVLFAVTGIKLELPFAGTVIPPNNRERKVAFQAALAYQVIEPTTVASWFLEVEPEKLKRALEHFPPDELVDMAISATAAVLEGLEFGQCRDVMKDREQLEGALMKVQSVGEAFGLEVSDIRFLEVTQLT